MKLVRLGVVAPRFRSLEGDSPQAALAAILRLLDWAEVTLYITGTGGKAEGADRSWVVENHEVVYANEELFLDLDKKLRQEGLSDWEEKAWLECGPSSESLLEALRTRDHDLLLLTPSLSPLVYEVSGLAPSRSILLADFQEAAPVRLKRFEDWFPALGAVVFASQAELRLAQRLYCLEGVERRVLGLPVASRDVPRAAQGTVGLISQTLKASQFRDNPNPRARVGLTLRDVDPRSAFQFELLQCWATGVPLVVDEECPLARELCYQADGGVVFSRGEGLKKALDYLGERDDVRMILGAQGREFVRTRCDPAILASRYRSFLEGALSRRRLKGLHFALHSPAFLKFDAVSNYLSEKCRLLEKVGCAFDLHIQDHLQRSEFSSHLRGKDEVSGRPSLALFDYPGYYPLMERLKASAAITVFDYHGVTPSSLWPDDSLERSHQELRLARQADYVIVHSRYLEAELIQEHGVDSAKVLRFPYSVDLARFSPGPSDAGLVQLYGLEGKTVLIYVGRMAPNKRIDVLVRCLSSLPRRYFLLLVGDIHFPLYAGEVEKAKKLAEEIGVSDRVIFAGSVSDAELTRLYNCADLMVSASLHEGFGIPFIEAMACGLPCVGANTTAVPEVIGKAGRVFGPGDAADLAASVEELMEDRQAYLSCVEAGLRQVQLYSREALEDNLIEALSHILQGGR